MKILLIHQYFLGKNKGGGSRFNEMAKNESNDKIIVPYEATEFVGSLSILSSFLGNKKAEV